MKTETKIHNVHAQQVPACRCQSSSRPAHQIPTPGRKLSQAEATQRLLAKNAELYQRLAK